MPAPMLSNNRIIWNRVKPNYFLIWLAVLILWLGLMVAVYYMRTEQPASIDDRTHAYLAVGISIALAGILVIIATNRYWFRSLRKRGPD